VNASSLPSWEDCIEYYEKNSPEDAAERVERLKLELAQAEAVAKKLQKP
jgi:hypothetical protein